MIYKYLLPIYIFSIFLILCSKNPVDSEIIIKNKISGKIKDKNGIPIQGITVSLSGSSFVKIENTNENGIYIFDDLISGEYIVKPNTYGFIYNPKYLNIIIKDSSIIVQDIIAEATPIIYNVIKITVRYLSGVNYYTASGYGSGMFREYEDRIEINCSYYYERKIRESIFPYRIIRTERIENNIVEIVKSNSSKIKRNGIKMIYEDKYGATITAEKLNY